MPVVITRAPPTTEAVHIDLAGRDQQKGSGVLLTLSDPDEILRAAKQSRAHRADWIIWRLETLPGSEHQAASFAVSLGRRVRGRVFVVLDEVGGRSQRIAGHLRRAGCDVDAASLSVED